uniref:Ig-like domain-containing protein n=1 Tax=Gouania willdenowi TaxID=441366 RepID=A0A8C5DT09_GOUWI
MSVRLPTSSDKYVQPLSFCMHRVMDTLISGLRTSYLPLEQAPLTLPLKSTSVSHAVANEGDNVKFICNIDNYDSTTEVTWYCGVRQLEAGDKYEIEYEDGLAVIIINKVTRSDDGTYRCKVVNEYGEDSAYAELVDTARMLQKPPEFTLPLVNQTAYLGENVRFGVTITVHPDPRVIWHKSGQKLIPGQDERKYTFITDKGLYQLIIHSLEEEDDAEYSVVARNRYGDDSCKARLTVVPRPKPADLTLRPMFKRLLANVECREGQNVRFEIRVSGHPTLKWEKDGCVCHMWSQRLVSLTLRFWRRTWRSNTSSRCLT